MASRTAIVAAWLWLAAEAAAQPTAPAEPTEYQALIAQAVREFDAQNFQEARALFVKAHASYPNARALRGLGVAEFELRNYRSSADHLTQALASQVKPLAGALRAQTEETLARARAFLGELHLTVHPRWARVSIDGAPIDIVDGTPVVLQVGDYLLEVRAPGYLAEKRPLSVHGGDRHELAIRLTKLEPEAPEEPNAAATPGSAADQASGAGAWPWVVVSASGAAAICGGVLVALAQSDIDTVERVERGQRWSDIEGAYDAAPTKSTAGFALLGAGIVGIGAGLIWHFLSADGQESGSVRVAAPPDGASVLGRF
jgi:hypothetical protein